VSSAIRRSFILTAVGVLAILVAACREDREREESEITKVIKQVITEHAVDAPCEQAMTKRFVGRIYGSAERCRKAVPVAAQDAFEVSRRPWRRGAPPYPSAAT